MSVSTTRAAVHPVSRGSLNGASDEVLARRVGKGDEAAFEEIYRRYADRLFRYCASILGSREEAEEAMQSVLFSAFGALREPGREVRQVRAWLYRIAHNRALDMLRRRREAEPLTGLEQSPAPRPDDQAAIRADLAQLQRDLAALEPLPRSALVLRELGGLSHAEIGVALESTPTGAKRMISEAREALYAFEQGRGLACAEVRERISDLDGRVLRGRTIRGHLRHCSGCESFRARIAARRRGLPLLYPPLAAPAAQAGLEAILGTGGSAGTGALVTAGAGGGGLALKAAVLGLLALGGGAAVMAPLGVYGGQSSSPAPSAAPASSTRASVVLSAPAAPAAARVTGSGGHRAVVPAVRARTTPASGAASPAQSGEGGGGSAAASGSTGSAVRAAQHPARGSAPVSSSAGAASAHASADLAKGRVSGGVKAGPASAGVSVDAPAGKASVGVAAGPIEADVSADASHGAATVGAQAGPASAEVSADASSGSADATVSTPVASATVPLPPLPPLLSPPGGR